MTERENSQIEQKKKIVTEMKKAGSLDEWMKTEEREVNEET